MEDQAKIETKGGTMRLGAYPCKLLPESRAAKLYAAEQVSERHRHRFEVNNDYRDQLAKAGLTISGTSPDEKLVEMTNGCICCNRRDDLLKTVRELAALADDAWWREVDGLLRRKSEEEVLVEGILGRRRHDDDDDDDTQGSEARASKRVHLPLRRGGGGGRTRRRRQRKLHRVRHSVRFEARLRRPQRREPRRRGGVAREIRSPASADDPSEAHVLLLRRGRRVRGRSGRIGLWILWRLFRGGRREHAGGTRASQAQRARAVPGSMRGGG